MGNPCTLIAVIKYMKHLFFLLALYLFPALTYSQTWETVKIDNAVSVKLPKGSTKSEKDKKYSLVAVSPFGTILIFKAPDVSLVTPDIEKERHLQEYYDDYIDNVKKSSSDAIIKDEKDTLLGELTVKDFTLQIDSGSGVLYRDFRILHANNATYTFEYLYQDIHKEYALPERERFFNSIEVNERLIGSDQFTKKSLNEGQTDNSMYLVLGSGAVLLIIGLVIFFMVKSKRKSSR